ncbi:MAG: formimidoylglutamase [Balneolaceae bacterium]
MNDPRLRDIINSKEGEKTSAEIILFPSDEGVKINGGRTGAANAPSLILDQLLKLTPHPLHVKKHISFLENIHVCDDLVCSGNVEKDQELLGKTVAESFQKGAIPIIFGGGHETAFGHFLGYAAAEKPVNILNIDAHSDVRPLKNGQAHSGSPFYQAINHSSKLCRSYNVAGINPSSISEGHFNFVKSQGECLMESETTLYSVKKIIQDLDQGNLMITMDMDAVNQGQSPGVSAPNSSGISSSLWLDLAYEFGKNPAVTSFDISEVNPEYDRDHQTVRLAAMTIWKFLLGIALR